MYRGNSRRLLIGPELPKVNEFRRNSPFRAGVADRRGAGRRRESGIVAAQRYDARDVAISFFVASQLGG
jgi:hypothetical protein